MDNGIPDDEILSDLQATEIDMGNLKIIVQGISRFINSSGGEDRYHLKIDLYKYQDLFAQAIMLKAEILKIAVERGLIDE